jgi:dTDP-4-amino-4,6-dideoxygalactose transaminase
MNIPISKTVFTKNETDIIIEPLRTGWVVQGPFVKEFEEKWCSFTGAKNSIAVSNCTTALHLSLAAAGVGYGDEVIVPAFTWVSTANAVEYLGAKPVFCDIKLDTFNIDVDGIENLINERTKAIIPVHLFGLPVNMDDIMIIADKYGIRVIEDAACGFGSYFKNIHVGNFGITGCFSFHPRKAITTGEGGMITTYDDELAKMLRSMRDHGASTSDHQRHLGNKPYLLPDFPMLGYNYRMTDIQASIGSAQMDRADEVHEMRSKIAAKYDRSLKDIEWLKTPYLNDQLVHGYQAYVCLFNHEEINKANIYRINEQRNRFMEYLQESGISTRPGTHAVHMLEYYVRKYNIKPEDFPNSWYAYYCSIALPLFPSLSETEFEYIIEKIRKFSF